MERKPKWYYRQSGVIPFRRDNGEVQIALITSKRRKRWMIPKGVIDRELSPRESATKEAYEEAGLRGYAYAQLLGEYKYRKWGGTCNVQVFLFKVKEALETWPEAHLRDRRWVNLAEVEELIEEYALKQLIRDLQVFIGEVSYARKA